MLLSVKIQLFVFFCVIFATFLPLNVVSSTSAQKVKRASLPNVVMRIYEKMDHLTSRVDQLESNRNNDTFDAQELMAHITRAISDSHGQIIKQFEEKLEETIEKIEQNILKKMERFDEKLNKIKIFEEQNFKKIDDNFKNFGKNITKIELNNNNYLCEKMEEKWNRCLTTQPPTTTTISSITVCHPNPCLHGGRCQPSSTGSGYQCVDCPKFRSGSRCETVECTVDNRCWLLNDTLYAVIETNLTWAEAKVKCESLNMTLAMPKDYHRTIFLYDHLKTIYKSHKFLWIGLKREVKGWFWLDGSAVGEYTGGWPEMKSKSGSYFGQLDVQVGSRMWIWGDTTEQRYLLCETGD